MTLVTAQHDRARGVLLGTAAGDALGAPYEFQPPRRPEQSIGMVGGGTFGWEPGEWTDDTSMAVVIAQVAASGLVLTSEPAQDAIVRGWYDWAADAPDVGNQTRSVLSAAGGAAAREGVALGARHARLAAGQHHARYGESGGNGSLMRTAPVALALVGDPDELAAAARAISGLTHHDPEAAEACVLWCLAVRHAVLTAELDVRCGLPWLEPDRQAVWLDRIDVAEARVPADFPHNGWVVEAFQAAWSAIAAVRDERAPLVAGLEAAVRGGYDTDTVAAIAGGLLGAACGASAVPDEWRRVIHGWPGLDTDALLDLADRTMPVLG